MSKHRIRWTLAAYDVFLFALSCIFLFVIYPSSVDNLSVEIALLHVIIAFTCVFCARFAFKVYEQIWRYAGPHEYILLLISDGIACLAFVLARDFLPQKITVVRAVALIMMDLLWCIALRLIYQLVYQRRTSNSWIEKCLLAVLRGLTGTTFADEKPGKTEGRFFRLVPGDESEQGNKLSLCLSEYMSIIYDKYMR